MTFIDLSVVIFLRFLKVELKSNSRYVCMCQWICFFSILFSISITSYVSEMDVLFSVL